MSAVTFYFQVHQPYRLKSYDLFSIGEDSDYFDQSHDSINAQILRKIAYKCYLPTNKILLDLSRDIKDFSITFSFSGMVLEQLEQFAPEVLKSFQDLVQTGKVEVLSETYHHSLTALFSQQELIQQINLHKEKIHQIFGVSPTSFRNTELIYNDELAKLISGFGYKVILAEGVDRYLGWRSPNFVYSPPGTDNLSLLLKNYKLSDDIAFRFGNKQWPEWPITVDKYINWLERDLEKTDVVNLFLDYETFGEHQELGIQEFLGQVLLRISQHSSLKLLTVSQVADQYKSKDVVSMPEYTSWADMERDTSAWLFNPFQRTAARALYNLEKDVLKSQQPQLVDNWRRLQSSDHLYYMSTKVASDGGVHAYFSPYHSAHEAFINYMNVLHDLRQRV